MFSTLATAPSAWQRPYHKCSHGWKQTIIAQHQVAMTTAIYLICISRLHYRLMPNMVNLMFRPPPPALPLSLHFNNRVCTRCVSHEHKQQRLFFFLHAGCEQKEEMLVPVRPVRKLSNGRQNCFLKIRKWCVVKLLLEDNKGKAIHSLLSHFSQSRYTSAGWHSPSQLFLCQADADKNVSFDSLEYRCPSKYCWNVGLGPWSPHTKQHSAALSTCLQQPAQRAKKKKIYQSSQRDSTAKQQEKHL